MANGDIVHTGVRNTTYSIRVFGQTGGRLVYDWVDSTGNESNEWFDSIEEAIEDAE